MTPSSGTLAVNGRLLITQNVSATSALQGLRVNYTSTANYTAETSFNAISAIYGGQSSAAVGQGTIGFSVSMSPQAPIAPATWSSYDGTELYALTAGLVVASTTPLNTASDLVAASFGVTVNATTEANGATGSHLYAINATTNIGAAGVAPIAHAVHVEQAITTGGQILYRDAFSALANGQAPPTTFDAAYAVACAGVTTVQCYGNLLALEDQIPHVGNALLQPLTTTASLIAYDNSTACSSTCPMTLAHGINLPNVTFTFDYMKFKNWTVNSAGREVVGEVFMNSQSPADASSFGANYVAYTAVTSTDKTKCFNNASTAYCLEIFIGTDTTPRWIPIQ